MNSRTLKVWGSDEVQLVIADTGPINYLIQIGHIDILPALFVRVILPSAVRDEDASMEKLDDGEADAIALAVEIHADLLLMDDREVVNAARRKGLKVTGTLGVLGLAAQHGLLNLAEPTRSALGMLTSRQPRRESFSPPAGLPFWRTSI